MVYVTELDINGEPYYSITLGDSILLQKKVFLMGDRVMDKNEKGLKDENIAIIQLCERVLELENKIPVMSDGRKLLSMEEVEILEGMIELEIENIKFFTIFQNDSIGLRLREKCEERIELLKKFLSFYGLTPSKT